MPYWYYIHIPKHRGCLRSTNSAQCRLKTAFYNSVIAGRRACTVHYYYIHSLAAVLWGFYASATADWQS